MADEHSAHRPGAAPLAPATTADADRFPPPTPEALQAAFPALHDGHDHMRGSTFTKWQLERLEEREDERTEFFWDGKVSWGNELDRLWLGSEGHRVAGTGERQFELFWTHAFTRWWESRLGLRRDAAAGETRDWLELGLQGEAPYGVEVEALAFAGEDERTALRLVLEYEARLTNRLQLVPRVELNAYGRDEAWAAVWPAASSACACATSCAARSRRTSACSGRAGMAGPRTSHALPANPAATRRRCSASASGTDAQRRTTTPKKGRARKARPFSWRPAHKPDGKRNGHAFQGGLPPFSPRVFHSENSTPPASSVKVTDSEIQGGTLPPNTKSPRKILAPMKTSTSASAYLR
ncbi:MAG: copper resistance protein [Moraxellaceae bacterium]|nr:copper resistance protein [Moraxellaceae bacterium]